MEDLQKMMQMRRTKMINIEKYKNKISECKSRCELGRLVCKLSEESCCKQFNPECGKCEESIVKWLFSEYKEPVLDEEEKAYLRAVVKPFRSRNVHICKQSCYMNCYYLRITLNPLENDYQGDCVNLPKFKRDAKMYKGMETNKSYSLEELGL